MVIEAARVEEIRLGHEALASVLDERRMRLWAAAEGRGGVAAVTAATGIKDKRIGIGMRELAELEKDPPPQPPQSERVRRSGAGRKALTTTDETLWSDLERPVDPVTRGDPESPLRWTTRSTRRLADDLRAQGHQAGARTVAKLL
jgi:hypothetical protein